MSPLGLANSTYWFGEPIDHVQEMVVVVDMSLLISENDPVQIREIPIEINAIVIGAPPQVVLAALQ